ncbi:S41 family peptidase [Streptomyces sp. 21So2-11]|uniref:S41 family peptidase n=1 Tax=Streptomyces sp. 21So2-11 TaxID=3144408 RepID=UPI00321C0A13
MAVAATVAAPATASSGSARGGADTAYGQRSTWGAALDGVWRSDGYQQYLTVDQGRLRTYEMSAAGCLPGRNELTASRPGLRGGVPFRNAEGVRQLTLSADGSAAARLSPAGSVGVQRLKRVATLPANCASPPSDDPVHTFDVFWATLKENYPFFHDKGIDWDAVRERYRPQVDGNTSDDRLFTILSAMIEPLHDLHTSLSDGGDGPDGRRTVGLRPGTPYPTSEYLADVEKATRAQLPREARRYADGKVQFADLPQGIGYLRITSFAAYGERDDADADARILDAALDKILTQGRIRTLRGLVVDLRFNGGGSDALGIQIAERLTDRPYTAYTKRARNNPDDPASYTAGQPVRVRPASGVPRYTGGVAVLTGPLTISVGETFTQSLMGRHPAPLRIGENTQGVFSDTMDRSLPNGWSLTLPNEKYLNAAGSSYDGAGIPPQRTEPVYAKDDVERLRDPALNRALRELRSR